MVFAVGKGIQISFIHIPINKGIAELLKFNRMKIKKAEFIVSNKTYEACIKTNMPEYAFIGRSNVGKSSLVNMLTGHSKLAKTSSRPGKTQLINHFLINDEWYLVDLPGYGWAKISQKERDNWDK